MNNPNSIEPRSVRTFLSGLSFLGGMLALNFVQCMITMNLAASAESLAGIAATALLYSWLVRDIPQGVDTISSQVARLPENIRTGLHEYLKGQDRRQ